jgi:AacA4 family aminoglycoside N(6')-acetyltransferase
MNAGFGTLTFKPLTHQDLPLLHAWLQRPHVAQWWHEPTSLADLERDYGPRTMTASSSTRAYVAMLDGEPIGFIQSYVAMGSGDGWWEQETDPGTRGIDQFLANAEQLGRGLGSTMIRAFVESLFQDPAVTKVQTDPSPENERAIRCYRRAGFVVHGEVITPDGPALLMLRYRADPASRRQQAV